MHYHRLQIANKKAIKTFKKWHPEDRIGEPGSVELGFYRKTKIRCSNPYCCGNPRRSKLRKKERLTPQELRAIEAESLDKY